MSFSSGSESRDTIRRADLLRKSVDIGPILFLALTMMSILIGFVGLLTRPTMVG